MRDYTHFDQWVDDLTDDVYAQPPDPGHTAWALHALEWLKSTIYLDEPPRGKVLDVGCGQAFLARPFQQMGLEWQGVAIGEDVSFAKAKLAEFNMDEGKVQEADMTFLPFEDEEFDLIFARHVLEHSPFPIITLMEWNRVTRLGGHLCLVAPAPHYWKYHGRNHYSIVPMPLLKWWCERSGWEQVHEFAFDSRDPLFLKHLGVYQDALAGARSTSHEATKVLEQYPQGPVEFRFIRRKGEVSIE
jgi:SAM-dependent methyltransferase